MVATYPTTILNYCTRGTIIDKRASYLYYKVQVTLFPHSGKEKVWRRLPNYHYQEFLQAIHQVGNFVKDGEVFPLDILYYNIFKKKGLKLRNRIIWHTSHGLHMAKRFSGRYETILWFTKGDEYKFNLDAVRIPSKYPGKRHFKGPNKGKPSGNPLGKNPSDIWEILVEDWSREIWQIPNIKASHPEKTVHPCQFPIELVERCVLALTDENDWVFDPYCGVGSSLVAGLKQGRRAIGCDKEARYIEIAQERIEAFYRGELAIRPMDRDLYTPVGKVSRVPNEWRLISNSLEEA